MISVNKKKKMAIANQQLMWNESHLGYPIKRGAICLRGARSGQAHTASIRSLQQLMYRSLPFVWHGLPSHRKSWTFKTCVTHVGLFSWGPPVEICYQFVNVIVSGVGLVSCPTKFRPTAGDSDERGQIGSSIWAVRIRTLLQLPLFWSCNMVLNVILCFRM